MSISPRLLLAGAALLAVSLADARTLIHAGALIDGRADAPRKTVTIVLDGERIAAIEDGYTAPAVGDAVIELKDATVLPGLIDCHVHLTDQQSPKSYTERFYLNPADYAYRSVVYARRTLMAGFTTVRDLGADDYINVALRKAIAEGLVEGPRVFAVGTPIGSTGGHADPTTGLNYEIQDRIPTPSVINGPDDARRVVREHFKHGVDLIKIMPSGGVLSLESSGDNPQLDDDEIRAVVTTAHEYGLKVAAHAHGAEAIRRAVLGGVDSIEHGTYMNDEDIALMKEHGTWFVPTISAGRFVADKAKIDGYFPEVVRAKAAAIGPLIQATAGRAYRAGVKMALGTDQGVAPHGENAREFVYLVEAGVPPMKAIQMGTINGAMLIGKDDQFGSVEKGKLADLVAVPGDPLADISLMTKVSFVMKAGKVYKQ
ncbi:MAG TPA: amidohydrolase family protein [Lacunisphaera sp.]|nr:amidohydrolase family protein [Lacunisphaera sp.]